MSADDTTRLRALLTALDLPLRFEEPDTIVGANDASGTLGFFVSTHAPGFAAAVNALPVLLDRVEAAERGQAELAAPHRRRGRGARAGHAGDGARAAATGAGEARGQGEGEAMSGKDTNAGADGGRATSRGGSHAPEPEWVPIRRLRCSKCRKEPVRLLESWHAYITFDVKSGERRTEGYKHEDSPYLVTAECECGHRWDLRCAMQITGVDRECDHGVQR